MNQIKCDFCETRLDEHEELTPMRIGDAPQPKPIRIEEISDRRREEPRRLTQLHDVVQHIDRIDVGSGRGSSFEPQYDHDKVGVGLRIRPDAREVTPDAMLCPICAESFRNL